MPISDSDIFIRLTVSLVLALILGIEREWKQQPAGIRTHVLICVGSALLMIVSIMLPEMYDATAKDPARIAAQVVSGIGFLWAWAIMRYGMVTKWLTTAANIWATAAIGLAVGAGMYFAAIVTTTLILINLVFFTKMKPIFLPQTSYCEVNFTFDKKSWIPANIFSTFARLQIEVISENIRENHKSHHVNMVVRVPRSMTMLDVRSLLSKHIEYEEISLSEDIKV
jgi:putative Mg2+ transporter-C (MgtC) family protein